MGRRTAVCEGGLGQEPVSSSMPILAVVGTDQNSEKTESSTRLGTVRDLDEVGHSRSGWNSSTAYHLIVVVVVMVMVVTVGGVEAEVAIEQVNSCKAVINGFTYNLEPLMRNDGHPRFVAEGDPNRWNYSFNPCLSFNLPVDPHEGTGDQCHYVAVCQWRRTAVAGEYFSLGIQRNAKFTLLRRPIVDTFQNSLPSSASNRPDSRGVKNGSGRTTNHLQLRTITSMSSSQDETADSNSTAIYSNLSDSASIANSRTAAVIVPVSVVDKASEDVSVATVRDMLRESAPTDESTSSKSRVSLAGSDPRKGLQGESETARSEQGGERLSSEYVNSMDKTGGLGELEAVLGKYGSRREDDGIDRQHKGKPDSMSSTLLPVTTSDGQHASSILQKRIPTIVFSGLRTKTRKKVFIYLVCDYNRTKVGDAILQYINYPSHNKHLELRHRCCCPNGCIGDWLSPPADYSLDERLQTRVRGSILTTAAEFHHSNRSEPSIDLSAAEAKHPPLIDALPDTRPRYIWLILVINAAILVAAVFVAGVCCKKGGMSFVSSGTYGYVPTTIHGSRLTMDSTDLDGRYVSTVKLSSPDYRDYGSPGQQSRLPSLVNCVIPSQQLEVGQRLGGGLFSDTYLAEWKKRRVAVKRITVRVHQNQLTEADSGWIEKEILRLSQQRHRNLVTVLGICIETRQPYVITELIEGDSLKEKINSTEIEQTFSWLQRIKLCLQVADGMAFLHSAKNPVLHRDLRCANILIDPYGKAKIVDFGMTRIIQRLRNECDHGSGCYCQKEQSAYPASVRWTAPEILRSPTALEDQDERRVFSTACDVYSFAMVCWEIASYRDPFEDSTEEQVIELVLQGARPPVDSLLNTMSPFRELMKACWAPMADNRPTYKQIAVTMKSIQQVCGRYPSQSKRKRSVSESTSYLRSALNMSEM